MYYSPKECTNISWESSSTKATSATEACRDARELVNDGVSCAMAGEMLRWLQGGHAERSFARHVYPKGLIPTYTSNVFFVLTLATIEFHNVPFHPTPNRWCKEVCTLQPDSVDIPLTMTNEHGDEFEMMKDTAVLWPWDFFKYLADSGKLLQWISDDPGEASARTTQYWTHCENLDFFQRLELPAERYGSCVPLFFHTDGVKIYKNQKAWIYSLSSACRKGPSMQTKFVFIIVRDNMLVKPKTHDAIGRLVGYMVDVLMTGCYPLLDHEGHAFKLGTLAAERAGQPFASGWSMAFAGFKGDWEARVMVHKITRYYRTTWICEHCVASYKDDFTFGDFRATAHSQSLRFTNDQFMALNPANDQSSWLHVKGWTKDRNLEESGFDSIEFCYSKYFCF